MVATRCHLLRLKCTKFDLGWGSLQRSPDPLGRCEGLTCTVMGGGEWDWVEEGLSDEWLGEGKGKGIMR